MTALDAMFDACNIGFHLPNSLIAWNPNAARAVNCNCYSSPDNRARANGLEQNWWTEFLGQPVSDLAIVRIKIAQIAPARFSPEPCHQYECNGGGQHHQQGRCPHRKGNPADRQPLRQQSTALRPGRDPTRRATAYLQGKLSAV